LSQCDKSEFLATHLNTRFDYGIIYRDEV